MKFRKIKQYHLPNILSIAALFFADSFAYYISYIFTNGDTLSHGVMLISWRIYVIVIVIIFLLKNYNPSPRVSRWKEAKNIVQSFYITGILYTFGKILTQDITIDQSQENLLFLHLFLFIDIPLRCTVRTIQRLFLKKGIGGRSTILFGATEDAQNVAREILCDPTLGFDLNGYFNNSESEGMNCYCSYLGSPDNINSFIQDHNIREMIIVLGDHEHHKLLELIGRYEILDICIKIVPHMYESISGQARIDVLNGIPLMGINPNIMTEFQSFMKRIIDIVFSLASMILLLPLCLVLVIIVGLGSTGGVLYKQIRLGKNGIRFNLYKLRTMYINSEISTGPIWSDKKDPRITPAGKVLRKFHLDEIPQLFNVFIGEMSIVGPRPERPKIIDALTKEIPYYSHRMKVKPGITGWAQIWEVYDASLEDVYIKLKHDFYYIEKFSLFLDFKVLLLTVWTIIKGKGR